VILLVARVGIVLATLEVEAGRVARDRKLKSIDFNLDPNFYQENIHTRWPQQMT
jgi:hypothetical protein